MLGVIALAGRAPYASSKAGVMNLTRVLALEWAGTGVTANTICPGPFGTEMNRPLLDDPVKYKEFVKRIPMGRWGELDELAGAVVFLASDASQLRHRKRAVRRWGMDGEVARVELPVASTPESPEFVVESQSGNRLEDWHSWQSELITGGWHE